MSSLATALGLPHHARMTSRREWLTHAGAGFGGLALASLVGDGAGQAASADPLAPRPPHHPARAKSVIFLFMEGGPSHIDLFDPKPLLKNLAGSPLPASFGTVITAMGEAGSPLLADQRTWKQHGRSGTWVSDWLPHTAGIVDEIAVIRSCVADGINHSGGGATAVTVAILPWLR